MSEKQMDYVNIDKIQPNDIIANSQLTINRNFAELAEKLNNIIHLLGTNGVFDNYYPIDIEWNKSDNGMIYGNMILNDELETELPTQPLPFATQEMGGILSTTSQAIAGNKTFINDIILSYDKLNKKWSSLKGIDSRPIITQYPNSVVIGDPSDPKKSISINYKDGKVVSITSGVFDTEQIKNDFTDYLNSELAKLQEKIISGITDANKKLCDYFKIPFDQQNDKKIENWWGNTHITTENNTFMISGSLNEKHFIPWNITDGPDNHIGDTYVDIANRKCYIYLSEKNNYIWTELDGEQFKGIIQILLDAANALSVTDGMSRTFVSNNCPDPPYDKGDMWIKTDNQNNAELLYCIKSKKADEKGDEKDWGSFTAYIKEDALDAWKNDLEEQLKNQLDKKISNWFGVGSPEGEDGNQKRPWLDDSDSDFDEDKFHENDIYTDIGKLPQGESDDDPDVSATAGYTWAFIKQEDNKTYKWIKTGQMSAFEQLLQSIGGIDGIKDGLRDYYYVTYGYWNPEEPEPKPTHKVGDIWVVKIDNTNPKNNNENYLENEVYMCMKSDEKNPHKGWESTHWMRILSSTDYNDLVEKISNTQSSLDSINRKFTSLNDDNVFSLLEKITIRNEWLKISGESKDYYESNNHNRPTSTENLLNYYINGSFHNTYKIIQDSKLESSIDQSILSGYKQSFLILSKYLISCKLFENSDTQISDISQPSSKSTNANTGDIIDDNISVEIVQRPTFKDTLLSYFTDYYTKEQNILIILQTLKTIKKQNDGQIRQFASNCPVWEYKFPDFENWNYADHLGDVYRDVSSGNLTSGWLWRFTEGDLEENCKKEDYPNPTGILPIPKNLVIEDSDSDSDSDNNKKYHWHHETSKELDDLANRLEELANKYQNSDDDDFTLFVKKPNPYIYQAGDIWIVHKDDYNDNKGVECMPKNNNQYSYAKQGDFLVAKSSNITDCEHKPEDWELTDVSESIKQSTLEKSGLDVLTKIATDGTTNIEGGLVLTNLILMKDVNSDQVQGGISGKKDDRVGLFFGDSYDIAYQYANQFPFEDYKQKYNSEKDETKKENIVNNVSNLLNELNKSLPKGITQESTKNDIGSLYWLLTRYDWTHDSVKKGIRNYFNDQPSSDDDSWSADTIRTYVDTQPKHPSVLITKDGKGSNIGGCYIDDLSKLRVPSDHIDNLSVNTLKAIEDGSTCVAKVDNSSFMIEDGKAYIKMSLYNGQPLVTGCDKDGNVVFEIGGHTTNGTANYQYNDTVFNILVNSNDLDKMSLTDVEKSRAVVNLPKVSIVPNWNNGVNEFKLTDIHFEYKIGTKNQYIQYEWNGLKDVKGKPIYQYGSETLLSKLESIYPTNCTNRKVTYNVGTKNQIISDTTSSTDKNNWCVKPDEGGLKFYSQTKSLEDLLCIGINLLADSVDINDMKVYARGPEPNTNRMYDPLYGDIPNINDFDYYYYSCMSSRLYKLVKKKSVSGQDQNNLISYITEDEIKDDILAQINDTGEYTKDKIYVTTGDDTPSDENVTVIVRPNSTDSVVGKNDYKYEYKIGIGFTTITQYLVKNSNYKFDNFKDIKIINTYGSTLPNILTKENFVENTYYGFWETGTLYIVKFYTERFLIYVNCCDSNGLNSNGYDNLSKLLIPNGFELGHKDDQDNVFEESYIKFIYTLFNNKYGGNNDNVFYFITNPLVNYKSNYLYYDSKKKCIKFNIKNETNYNDKYYYLYPTDPIPNKINGLKSLEKDGYTWLNINDSKKIESVRNNLLLSTNNPYWSSIKSYLKGSSVQLPKLYDVKFRAKYQYNNTNYGALYYNWSDSVICRSNNSVISDNTTVDNTKYVVSDFMCKYGDNNIISYKDHTAVKPQIQCSIMNISSGADITENITYVYELDSTIEGFSLEQNGYLKVTENKSSSPRQCKINIKIKYNDKGTIVIVGSESIIVTQECVVTKTYLHENPSIAQNFDHNFKELEDIYIKADVNFDKIESGSMETP